MNTSKDALNATSRQDYRAGVMSHMRLCQICNIYMKFYASYNKNENKVAEV